MRRGEVAVVAVERHNDAGVVHDGAVVRDGVVGLDLVRPPVGERRCTGPMRGDLVGNLVALENVLEGADLETELFRQPDEHQESRLVGTSASVPSAHPR